MGDNELKPCPFCAGFADVCTIEVDNYDYIDLYVGVKCQICGAIGKMYKVDDSDREHPLETLQCNMAVKAWNMRRLE